MENALSFFIPADTRKGLDKSVFKSLVFRLVGLALVFLSQVLLARLMGTKGFGDYLVILSILNVLLVISLFGFDQSVLRLLPAAISKKENGKAYGIVRFSYRIITILAVLSSIALFLFLLSKSKKFNISFSEGLFWTMLLLPVLAFLHQASAILRSFKKYKTAMLPFHFLLPLSIGSVCFGYYYSNHRLPVDAVMFISLLCTLVICIYMNRKAAKTLQLQVPPTAPEFKRGTWLQTSSGSFMISLLTVLLRNSDILLLSVLLGNAKAGIYAVALAISTLVSLGLSVTEQVYAPKIQVLWESKQKIKFRDGIRQASWQILAITIPLAVVLVTGGKALLGIFGEAFNVSYGVLIILIAGQLVNAATGMVSNLLTATGNQRMSVLFYLVGCTTQIVLVLVLVPWFGMIGAAIGSAFSLGLVNLLGFFYLRRRLKISASVF